MTKVITSEATSAKAVNAAVNGAIRAIGSYRDKVQTAAVLIIQHAEAYGDCSQSKILARGLPVRERNSLIGWFRLYSPIGINLDSKNPSKDRCGFIRNDKANAFNVEAAKANMWYNDPAKVNPEPKPLSTLVDFWEVIDRMIKAQIKAAEANESKYDPNVRETVKAEAEAILKVVNKHRASSIAKNSELLAHGGRKGHSDTKRKAPQAEGAERNLEAA